MTAPAVPPGWPGEVRPPGAPDWERSAVAWLLDLCPPDYRAYEVLRRHPIVLAHLATRHVEAGIDGAKRGIGTARRDLRDLVDTATIEAALAAYEREGARLVVTARSVGLVADALRGKRYVPRL